MRHALLLLLVMASAMANADTLFPQTAVPKVTAVADDASAVELGVRFQTSVDGTITAIRFYRGAGNSGPHTGTLWTAAGLKLGSVTFSNETATGWQQANLSAPIAIKAGELYVASYFAPAGRYAVDNPYFATARTSGALTTPVNAGVFRYGSPSGFPQTVWGSSNYWVDVIFTPKQSVPQPPADPTFTGEATLSWDPPPAGCTDGGTLCPILGYEIEHATASTGPWESVVTVAPTVLSRSFTSLAPGTHYWRLYTTTLDGVKSLPSGVVSKTITAETCTAPQPVAETRRNACPTGTSGTWTQTRAYASAPYPTCWVPGEWLPVAPPASACPAAWIVRAATTGTRPVYELVRDQGDTAWVRGYKLGDISTGRPCDPARELGSGTSEYHRVRESDVVLLSPTYRGRTLIAICARQ